MGKPILMGRNTYRFPFMENDVEVGDIESLGFEPSIKLRRWGEECFLKVGLPTNKQVPPIIEENKIRWITKDIEAHFYPLRKMVDGLAQNELGEFELELILNRKLPKNEMIFNIDTKGLDFYFQPPLTKEIPKSNWAEVTETEARNKDGEVVAYRPPNIVGSYAVYHESKSGDYSQLGGKNYRNGKAFCIYRPKVTDALGRSIWADLNINEVNETLTITIDEAWLDSAVYPILIDPTFGCDPDLPGGSYTGLDTDVMAGAMFASPSDAGGAAANSITVYTYSGAGTRQFKGVLVLHSNLNIVANGIGNPATAPSTAAWVTSSFSTSPTLSVSTEYVLMVVIELAWVRQYYDTGITNQRHLDSTNSYASPTNPTDAVHGNEKASIYCTYTPVTGQPFHLRGSQIPGMSPGLRGVN